jgi:hypothetical protein
MDFLQNLIHRLEVGGGIRFFRIGLLVLGLFGLFGLYNWRAFKNMSSQEAMDAAQLGRNIAQGKGYTTLFVRPLSMYLLKKHCQETPGLADSDPAQLKGMHPDLANPPVYPVVLAGLMKVLPFNYTLPTKPQPFWSYNGKFWRYQPDFLIAVFNQLLFLGLVVSTFFLARRLFDSGVAWLSALLLLGTELFWRFSVSGLSTILLLLLFSGLLWCLALLDEETRQPKWGVAGLFVLATLAGLLVGLGALTRYSFAWLIIPVLLFLILFTGRQRVVLALIAFFAFAAVLTPWVVRNVSQSGLPFGTASYSVLEDTSDFPEFRLQRSLEPDFATHSILRAFWQKLAGNGRQMIQTELPKLGGSWVSGFFLVGLLVGFRNPTVRRLRYFLVGSLLVLGLVQVLGRTQLSDESPDINSENLLVLVVPLVLVYGVSFFYLLLEQIQMSFRELRYLIIGLFSAAACLPMILTFLPPKTIPVAYPPYYPPAIQTVAGWMKESELTMSDVPWAMAWYGQRQCVWLTLNAQSEFFAINDYQKPISALYLTPATMDNKFLTQWILPGELSWGSFILESLVKKEVPPTFPLRKTQSGWLPNQLVLTDWERWRKTP